MNSKTSLFNLGKNFIYSPKLEDLHVFSKEYLNTVLKPHYASNSEKDNFVAICIDFNKLNDINNLYGYATGDKVIHYSLSLIKSVLPPNTISARIGGDEFVFLTNNCNPENIEPLISKIDSILKEHGEEILFSSVTSYGVHSDESSNLNEMLSEAELKISEQKNNFNNYSSHSKWGVLEKKLTQNLTSFFKSLRLYRQPITTDFLKTLYTHIINSCNELLEKDFNKTTANFQEQTPIHFSENLEFDKLYSIFLEQTPSDKEIENINEDTYSYLLNNLIHDPVTGNFSKNYFVNFLLENCNHEYRIKYISTSFIKLSNSIFSHSTTDMELKKITDNFITYLQDELGISFSNENFSESVQNYFISLGGGDYLIALPKTEDEELINNKINNYFSSITQNTSNLENILRLFCSKDFHSATKENIHTLLTILSNECKLSKDDYKLSILEEPMIKDAINNIIYDSAEYYIDNIQRHDDIDNKNKFLHLLAKTMLNISVDLNNEQQKNNEER